MINGKIWNIMNFYDKGPYIIIDTYVYIEHENFLNKYSIYLNIIIEILINNLSMDKLQKHNTYIFLLQENQNTNFRPTKIDRPFRVQTF